MGLVRGLITVILMASFIAMTLWVWSRHNKQLFDAASRMPLEDDPQSFPHPNPLPEPGEGARNSLPRFRERAGVSASHRESIQ
jgi:cytochrome c oxidase cbb3-type subunit 4